VRKYLLIEWQIQRHHKRTVYASNAFPVESYGWDCADQGLFYYGKPFPGHDAAHGYWKAYLSPINPYKQSGFQGTCQFPQITSQGLEDSWQHGKDLFAVYHDLLSFLPSDAADKVTFRVTNNQITSQVAGMLLNGMLGTNEDFPLAIQPSGIDSLEPQYSCPTGSGLFNSIRSGAGWNEHLTAAAPLFSTLDNISGVPPSDSGWHVSFDHYYDNLSARQCHAKPLPCKVVNGASSATCITQDLADDVYRLGHYEYSYIYRDDSRSLQASAATFGVWIAELSNNIRSYIAGKSDIIYRHNIAHDGSMSRLLSIMQLDMMVWPGMGSEVVFEVYKKEESTPTSSASTLVTSTPTIAPNCNRDNCLRQFIQQTAVVSDFCKTYTTAVPSSTSLPSFVSQCGGNASRLSSACSCVTSTPSATATSTSAQATPTGGSGDGSQSGFYVRVLWGGQVLRSSNPSLGYMDMLPLETLLEYFDGLAGRDASRVRANCGN
jgi:hypothetical protein